MVTFTITKHADGIYQIATKHPAYHHLAALHYENVKSEDAVKVMDDIANTMSNKYGEACTFKVGSR